MHSKSFQHGQVRMTTADQHEILDRGFCQHRLHPTFQCRHHTGKPELRGILSVDFLGSVTLDFQVQRSSLMPTPDLLGRLRQIEASHLADADKGMRVMDAGLRRLNPGGKLLGPARTVVAREDFMSVMVALDEAQPGEVLVVDTRGSRRAVLGELFSLEAVRRGLAGIVVDGPVRDVVTLRQLAMPVYARSQTPLAGTLRQLQPTQVPVNCGGVQVVPGDILLGDDDGIVVASPAELAILLPAAEAIEARERAVIARIQAGENLFGMLNFAEHRANLAAGRDSALRFLD
jgi:RraA family protein